MDYLLLERMDLCDDPLLAFPAEQEYSRAEDVVRRAAVLDLSPDDFSSIDRPDIDIGILGSLLRVDVGAVTAGLDAICQQSRVDRSALEADQRYRNAVIGAVLLDGDFYAIRAATDSNLSPTTALFLVHPDEGEGLHVEEKVIVLGNEPYGFTTGLAIAGQGNPDNYTVERVGEGSLYRRSLLSSTANALSGKDPDRVLLADVGYMLGVERMVERRK